MKLWLSTLAALVLMAACFLVAMASRGVVRSEGTTTRASVSSEGTEANSFSAAPSLSSNGRYVVFSSSARNLVDDDNNFYHDIFVHDRWSGETERINLSSEGAEATWDSYLSQGRVISDDGRYVTFTSWASHLVISDTNSTDDVFVHDRGTRQTTLVSVNLDGTSGYSASGYPTISGDGRYVAFSSVSDDLVVSDTNGGGDIFVRDLHAGQTRLVSVASDGTQTDRAAGSPSISADGRYIAFHSLSTTLVPDDTNDERDIFVHDRVTGQTERISVAQNGTEANGASYFPVISADGNYVAFTSYAINLIDGDSSNLCGAENASRLLLHNRKTGQTTCLAPDSNSPSLSADARYIAFIQVGVDQEDSRRRQITVLDRETGETEIVSVASDGTLGNNHADWPSVSADGRYVAFDSLADNLVDGDTNQERDVFVHDRGFTATHWLYLPITSRQSPN